MKLLIGTKIVTGVVSKKSKGSKEIDGATEEENDTLGIENKNYEPSHHTVLEIFEEPTSTFSFFIFLVSVKLSHNANWPFISIFSSFSGEFEF